MKKYLIYAIAVLLTACGVALIDYFLLDQLHGSSFLRTLIYYAIMFTIIEIVINWLKKKLK